VSYQESTLEESEFLSLDALHDLLAHHRRRHVLVCLNQHGKLPLADLADEVAAREDDEPITRISEDAVLRVYSSLWHAHIPKLAESNVVEYDQDQDIVALGANADQLQHLLSIDEAREGTPE